MLATPTAAAGPSVAETGATAQSFDAYSLLAPDAGVHSSLHYETVGRGYEGLNIALLRSAYLGSSNSDGWSPPEAAADNAAADVWT